MDYRSRTPAQTPEVVVEWLDITSADDLTRRWSIGWLISDTHMSEGCLCLLLAGTWDADSGWADYEVFPAHNVVDIEFIGRE